MARMTFLLTVHFPDILEKSVVRNYVTMAMAKYDKLVQKLEKHSGYFSGITTRFSLSEIKINKSTDLREIVSGIKQISDHFDRYEELNLHSHLTDIDTYNPYEDK